MATKVIAYIVEEEHCKDRIVNGTSQSAVRGHLCKDIFKIRPAKVADVVRIMQENPGMVVETAKPDPDQAELSL